MSCTIKIAENGPGDFFRKALLLFVVIFLAYRMHGQDLDADNDGIPDSYERGMGDFSLGNVFSINGVGNSAVVVSANELQLTQNGTSLKGSAMSIGKIDFTFDFRFSVEAYFGINNGSGDSNSGADGIAMVFHNDSDGSNAIGNDGEGMGAQGIQNGIVLEIDTYGNGNTGADDPIRSAFDDHTDIWDSDDNSRSSLIGGYIPYNNSGDRELEDGVYHLIEFSWQASTGTLSFTIDGLNAGSLSRGSASSFANTFFGGSRTVYFGFTASTGAAKNEHKIRISDPGVLPLVIDSDNDGIYDHLDLDSDNDGIYDAEEAQHGAPHTNGMVNGPQGNDGIPDAVQNDPNGGIIQYTVDDHDMDGVYNHQDIDADGDGCYDVVEALFSDLDNDGILGRDVPTVNALGVVINVPDGYTDPMEGFLNSNTSICEPMVDLGDIGDGFDREMVYTEDDPATYVVEEVSIRDGDHRIFLTMQIIVAGVLDGSEEILTIGGIEYALNTPVANPITMMVNNENINVTFVNNVFSFSATGGDGALDLATCEQIIESIQYHHLDSLTPNSGNRVLTVNVFDGYFISQPSTITIQVVPTNDLPVAQDDTARVESLDKMIMNISANDYDLDGTIDYESIHLLTIPLYGTASIAEDGALTYQSDVVGSGYDSLTYTILDNEDGISNVATVRIIVQSEAGNESPKALPDQVRLNQGDTLIRNEIQGVMSNDEDPDLDELVLVSFSVAGISYPAGTKTILPEGRLTVNTDGSYEFIPNPTFTGVLEVEYRISDGLLEAGSVLTITVDGSPETSKEDIEVSMIITRNGDQLNNYLQIENIAFYPNNEVVVFNRWGNIVWECSGYDNNVIEKRFEGTGNTASAGELPDGTYFYVIQKGDDSQPIRGFVTLKH